jgi:hypothetical protein
MSMKKIFAVLSGLCLLGAHGYALGAVIPWWQQPTICRPNPTNCYAVMGTGFDDAMWDVASNCRGMKTICAAAATNSNQDVLMSKTAIAAGTGINSDFDTAVLDGGCFGARKTIANGSQASVNGKYVNVWCSGVLSSADETLATGEIVTAGAQPLCRDIAPDGWIAVLNQKCYGKYYDPSNYYIECDGNNLLPSRLIQLNGAIAITGTGGGNYNYPTTTAAAKTLFDTMQATSATKNAKYFKSSIVFSN